MDKAQKTGLVLIYLELNIFIYVESVVEYLMRLYNIIYEGFKIDVQIPTETATTEDYQWYTAQLAGKTIIYSANDSPEDIIKIEPSLSAKKLSEFLVSKPTRAFKNSKIFIGFTTSPSSGEDTHDTSVFSPKEYHHLLDALYPVAREWTGQVLTQSKMLGLVKQLKNDQQAREQLGRDKADPEAAARLNEATNVLGQVHDLYMKTITSKGKAGKPVSPANYTVPEAIAFLKRNVFHNYGKAASYEIAKQLKHPENPSQRQITDVFLKLCLQQINKMVLASNVNKYSDSPRPKGYVKTNDDIKNDKNADVKWRAGLIAPKTEHARYPGVTSGGAHYEYIVYPQSSSQFNMDLATAAAKMYGAKTLEITKRTPTDLPLEVDEEAIRSQAEDYEADKHYDKELQQWYFTPSKVLRDTQGRKMKNETQYFKTKEAFVDFWTKNMSSGVNSGLSRAKNIKNIDDSKRAMIKNLFPNRDSYAELSNKFVLLIDDNIVSSGTVQMVKNLLMSIDPPPLCVDVFIPLKVETNT